MEKITVTIDQRIEYVKALSEKGDDFLKAGLEILQKIDRAEEFLTPEMKTQMESQLKVKIARHGGFLAVSPVDCLIKCAPLAAIPEIGTIAYAACVLLCLITPD